MNKTKKIIALILGIMVVYGYNALADKLDESFYGKVEAKFVEGPLQVNPMTGEIGPSVVLKKWCWGSTEWEHNGHKETYQGRHYLHCYTTNLFGNELNDRHNTGRKYQDRGFTLNLNGEDAEPVFFPALRKFKVNYGTE